MTTTPSSLPQKETASAAEEEEKLLLLFFFLLSREKRKRNSRIRAGWMDEKEWRGGIKQKRVAAENRIDRVNPLFACFLSLSIIFSPVSLYFILFYFILSADGKE